MSNIIELAQTKFASKLYPVTPIQIELEGDRIQFTVEGDWDSFEQEQPSDAITLRVIGKRLNEILLVNANYWNGQFKVLQPDWEGWKVVDIKGLAGLKPKFEPQPKGAK